MVKISDVAKAVSIHENTLRRYVLLLIDRLDLTVDELITIYVNTESYKVKMKVLEKLIKMLENDENCPLDVLEKLKETLEFYRRLP
jgi:hypothetical protein